MIERFEIAVKNARDAIEELRLASYERGYKDAVRDANQVAPTTISDGTEGNTDDGNAK